MAYATRAPQPSDIGPHNELPSGRYPLFLTDYQLRLQGIAPMSDAISDLRARVSAVEARPQSASVQVLPLVPASGTATPMMRPTNSVLITDTTAYDANVTERFGNVQADSIGVGGPPIRGYPLALRKGGEVVYLEGNVPEQETQEKSGPRNRAGAFSINRYDNGMRMIRGGFWVDGVLQRVQPVLDILGFDGAGTTSKSTEDYSKPVVERCQDWIIAMDWGRRKLMLTVCRAGWGVEVCGSTETTNYLNDPNDGRPNFNRSAEIIATLPGAV